MRKTHVNTASPADSIVRAAVGVFIFAIILAMSPQTRDATEPIKLLVLQAGALLLFTLLCAVRINAHRTFTRPGILLNLFAAYVALNVVSALLSDHPRYSLDDARRLVALLILMFVAGQIFTRREHLHSLLACVCIAVALSSVYALFQKAGLDPFPWADRDTDTYRQLPGTLGNPNVAGHAMVMALIAGVVLAFEPRRRWAALAVPIIALHFTFTGHRAGILALLAALAATAVVYTCARSTRFTPATKALGLTTLVVAGAIALLAAITGLAAANATSAVPADISTLVRINGYYNTVEMIADKPLTGHGPGAYIIQSPRYWTDFEQDWFESTRVMNRRVHNEYLESAVAAGLPGSALYIGFLLIAGLYSLVLAFSAVSSGDKRTGLFYTALFAGFAVDSAFGFNFNAPASGALVALAAGSLAGQTANGIRINFPASAVAAIGIILGITLLTAEVRRYRGEMHFHKGSALREIGRYTEAEDRLAKAEALTPWNWRFPRERGVARYETGDYLGAIPHFSRSLSQNPNWITTLIPAANAALNHATSPATMPLQERGQLLRDAIQYAESAITLNTHSALAHEALARTRYTQAALATRQDQAAAADEWITARDALQEAVAAGPEAPGVLLAMLGQAQSTLGEPDAAERSLAAAVRAAPDQETHWTTLYNFARNYGRYNALEELVSEALARSKTTVDRPRLLLWRAIARDLGDRDGKAVVEAYRAALQASPGVPEVWGQFGYYTGRTGRYPAYRETFLSMSRSDPSKRPPKIPGLQALEKVWTEESPDYAAALATLERAVENAPPADRENEARAVRWAAMILSHVIGEPETPADARTLVDVGHYLMDTGEYPRARASFEKASRVLKGQRRAEAMALTATVYARNGKQELAREWIDRALATAANNQTVALASAHVLHAEENINAARNTLEELLRSPRLPADTRTKARSLLERLP